MLALDVGDILQPCLQLRVFVLQAGNLLLEGHQLLLQLHVSSRGLQEPLVGELEGLADGQGDLLSELVTDKDVAETIKNQM